MAVSSTLSPAGHEQKLLTVTCHGIVIGSTPHILHDLSGDLV